MSSVVKVLPAMCERRIVFGLFAAVVVLTFATGCKKSPPAPPPPAPSGDLLARIHWLGKDRLASETNAAVFMRIWQQPESARLQAQTLEIFGIP